jgi:amidase
MADLIFESARAQLAALAAKQVSARELLDLHVAQKNKIDAALNAVIRTDLERARPAAAAVDDARARGETLGALAGLPMTIKDGLDVDGLPAFSGNPKFAGRPAACQDAEAVRRARAAGAIVWGKTNVPYMLADIQTYNEIFGATNNPYDVTRTCGGSSGGAAVALATGMTPLEIGSDIGGSLRHPANFCGVFSLKPTWELIPQDGHVPPPPGVRPVHTDFNVIGPMARTAEDVRLLFRVLTNAPAAPPAQASAKGARIAVWTEGFPLAAAVRERVIAAGAALRAAGAEVRETNAPVNMDALLPAYRDLLVDIIRADLNGPPDLALRLTSPLMGLQRLLGAGPFSRAGYGLSFLASPAKLAQRRAVRDRLKTDIKAFFETTDAILCPLTFVPAFPHNQKGEIIARTLDLDGRQVPYTNFINWIALATALHLPAASVPFGRTKEGLPVGVQAIGPWGAEEKLLDLAQVLEEAGGGWKAPKL